MLPKLKKKYNVSRERENWISVMRLPKFLSCPSSAHEWIVATKLPKMGGKKKRENCGNQIAEKSGRNLIVILGNKVAENEGTNLIVI